MTKKNSFENQNVKIGQLRKIFWDSFEIMLIRIQKFYLILKKIYIIDGNSGEQFTIVMVVSLQRSEVSIYRVTCITERKRLQDTNTIPRC